MASALSFCPWRASTCVSVRVTDSQGGVERGRRLQPSVRDWDALSSPVCTGALLFQSRRIEGFSESPDNLAAALKVIHAQVSVLIAWVCIRRSGRSHCPASSLKASVVFVPLHVVGRWFTVTLAVTTADCCRFLSFFFFRIAEIEKQFLRSHHKNLLTCQTLVHTCKRGGCRSLGEGRCQPTVLLNSC